MLLGINNHVFQDMPRREIPDLRTVRDPIAEQVRIFPFKIQIGSEQRFDSISMRNGINMLHVRSTV